MHLLLYLAIGTAWVSLAAAVDCGTGWLHNSADSECYLINSTAQLTWHEAYQWCTTQKSNLVSITSLATENFIVNHRVGLGQLWIGLHNRDPQNPGQFLWTDKSAYSYQHWRSGSPNTNIEEACVVVSSDGYWDASDCALPMGFACKRPDSVALPTFEANASITIAMTSACGQWYEHKGFCYKYYYSRTRWTNARSACFRHGAYLLDLLSRDEIDYIKALGLSKHVRSFWIGLNSRLNVSTFVWDDGTISGHPLSTDHNKQNWGVGEPNNRHGNELCTETIGYPSLKWNDVSCLSYRSYVCKRRLEKSGNYSPIVPQKLTSCPSGYKVFHHPSNKAVYCYVRHGTSYSSRKTWKDAAKACQDAGQDLVSIGDDAENKFVHDKVLSRQSYFWYGANRCWIGFADPSETRQYQWSDASAVAYTNWSPGEPRRYFGRNCAYINHYTDHWTTEYCNSRRAYICKLTLIEPKPSGPKPAMDKYCAAGWRLHGGFCYYVPQTPVKDHATATSQCTMKGGHLASIHSFGEQAFVVSLLASLVNKSDAYIGLSDAVKEGEYTWSDGSRVDYSFWAASQPNNRHNEDCVKLYQHRATWNDVACNTALRYVCKKPADQATKPSASPDSKCRTGWSQFNGNCFKVFGTPASFRTADTACWANSNLHGLHGSLAAVSNRADNFFLASLASEAKMSQSTLWIGLNDMQHEGSYKWTSNQPVTFVNWATGQPNDGVTANGTTGTQDCVAFISKMSRWADAQCGLDKPYFCMVPNDDQTATPPPPASPTVNPLAQCEPGWRQFGTKCFGFFGTITADTVTMKYPVITPQTWQESLNTCVRRGANMVSVHNQATQEFLATTFNSTLNSGVAAYWIGLSALNVRKGGYFWTDSSAVDYTHWAVHEPNDNHGAEDCVEVVLKTRRSEYRRRWSDFRCSSKRAFVCSVPLGQAIVDPKEAVIPSAPSDLKRIDCGPGWLQTFDRCYKLSTKKRTWTAAQRKCSHLSKTALVPKGAVVDLASIHNADDHIHVVQTLINASAGLDNGTKSNLWIGLNDRANESEYAWSDGSAVDYLPWSIGEPNDYGHQQDCGQIKGAYGYLFNDAACSKQFYSVCSYSRLISQNTTGPTCAPGYTCKEQCPKGWTLHEESCYKVSTVKMDYNEASENCSLLLGGTVEDVDLVTINSPAEQRWLTMQLLQDNAYYWIGLNDEDLENHFHWASGEAVTYTNWDPSQPNNFRGAEDCVAADGKHSGLWFDRPCDSFYKFICETPAKFGTTKDMTKVTGSHSTTASTRRTTASSHSTTAGLPSITEVTSSSAPTSKQSGSVPTKSPQSGTTTDGGKNKLPHSGPSPVAAALIGVLATIAFVALVLVVLFLLYRRNQKYGSLLAGPIGFRRLNADEEDDDDDHLLAE